MHSYFLTYNKAKGINEDTHSGPNEVRIVQGAPGEQSSLMASISPGSSISVPDYYNGRSLYIAVQAEVEDSGVNFVPVTVSLETILCTVDNDCIGNISTCNTSTCTAGTCVYSPLPDCCGNGICETSGGEYCSTCPTDCVSPTDCNELDGRSDVTVGGSSSTAAYGIKFNVDILSDISFYEIEADLSLGVTEGANIEAKIYTKVGSYDSSTTSWELVFSGSPTSTNYKITMPFTAIQISQVGSIRAFYISLQEASTLAWEKPGVLVSNSDATISLAEILAKQINDEIPGTVNFGGTDSFLGGLKYNYEQTTTTTSAPTLSSVPSALPSDQPSLLPSDQPSLLPSDQPSLLPSLSISPSLFPSEEPSMLPSDEVSFRVLEDMISLILYFKSHSSPIYLQPSILPSDVPSISSVPTKQNLDSSAPSRSSNPSGYPSASPSISNNPSNSPITGTKSPTKAPSKAPSKSPIKAPSKSPSKIPSKSPSKTPSASPVSLATCKDSGVKFLKQSNKGIVKKDCSWVGKQRLIRCGFNGVASHYPNT